MKEQDTIISEITKKLPQKPGVYQFFDAQGIIIYVGKAKNLRKRVVSYFTRSDAHSYKHSALVSKICDIKYVLVENESDALLLENNLIKEYQPRYNILLKDDKTFPWICIKKERFPRVMATRNRVEDGSEYYGPYTSALMVKTLLELIRQLYKLRTCNLLLCEEYITKQKYHRCLEFQLGNCLAPCEGLQNEEDYNENVQQIREILKGNLHTVIRHLYEIMGDFSKKMHFEQAEIIKNKITILEKFRGKSTIVNPKITQVDVFGIVDNTDFAYVNFLKVVQGAIVQSHNIEVVKRTDEVVGEILLSVIYDLRSRFDNNACEIIVQFKPEIALEGVKFSVPQRGDKLKLLELSLRNANSYKIDREASRTTEKKVDYEDKVLNQMKIDLRLKSLPVIIECFDNSNIQGSDPVASCVVFKSGKPFKSGYRHFNVKTVTGPNDFASMEEIVYRRYKRIMEEQGEIPDLIIIDGGKGQLSAATKSLKEIGLYGKVSVIGIAKKLEEIYVPEDPIPLYINKNSSTLRLIQRIRDEAHRFGITFHRLKRSNSQLESVFDTIPGIGEKMRNKILKLESDISKLKLLSEPELIKLIGKREAAALIKFFNQAN
ncbi:MAG TPA: excinuclease ABC subunit UvrC [Bacteroidales bacterium]|nr:excinuclease ABC subunit UvrC [Bacteroidales bacterium]